MVICQLLVAGPVLAAVPAAEVLQVRGREVRAPELARGRAAALDQVLVHDRAAVIWLDRDPVQVVRALVRGPAVYQRIATCRISSTFRPAVMPAVVHRLDPEWVRLRELPAERSPEALPRSS
jgi:hypothetical protein